VIGDCEKVAHICFSLDVFGDGLVYRPGDGVELVDVGRVKDVTVGFLICSL